MDAQEENKKLELIGDSIASLLSRELLYKEFPDIPKQKYDKLFFVITSDKEQSKLASNLNLQALDDSYKGLARAFETYLGRIYIEEGLEEVKKIYWSLLKSHFDIEKMAEEWDAVKLSKAIYL